MPFLSPHTLPLSLPLCLPFYGLIAILLSSDHLISRHFPLRRRQFRSFLFFRSSLLLPLSAPFVSIVNFSVTFFSLSRSFFIFYYYYWREDAFSGRVKKRMQTHWQSWWLVWSSLSASRVICLGYASLTPTPSSSSPSPSTKTTTTTTLVQLTAINEETSQKTKSEHNKLLCWENDYDDDRFVRCWRFCPS